MNRQIYIHYGSSEFDPLKGFPIKNWPGWCKPHGGLWGSRVGASFGWKKWCAREGFRSCEESNSFKFAIRDESKIVHISTLPQLRRLPLISNVPPYPCSFTYFVDFEKCLASGIDAVELCWYGDEYEKVARDDLYFGLYGWDCDSIVVLNPEAVVAQ